MKFLHSLLLPTVASSQLLGFGASCPSIEIDIENVGNTATSSLVVVAHSPDVELIPDNEPLSLAAEELIAGHCISDGDDPDYFLVEFLEDLPSSAFDYVCGTEEDGEGIAYVSADDIDGYVLPGGSYDTIYLNPVSEGFCSCGNMRISILSYVASACGSAGPLSDSAYSFTFDNGPSDSSALPIPLNGLSDLSDGAYGSDGSDVSDAFAAITSSLSAAAYLNSHELQSTTTTSHTAAVYLGMTCSAQDRDCWARPVSIASTSDAFQSDNMSEISHVDLPAYSTSRAFSVTFIPRGSSSTSFLSLWALLMHGWY